MLLTVLMALVLAGVVAAFVGAPLRHAGAAGEGALESTSAREELEAAREAKYREIRDTELDYRTGKLSSEDYAAIDAELRAEAVEILNRLELLTPKGA